MFAKTDNKRVDVINLNRNSFFGNKNQSDILSFCIGNSLQIIIEIQKLSFWHKENNSLLQ